MRQLKWGVRIRSPDQTRTIVWKPQFEDPRCRDHSKFSRKETTKCGFPVQPIPGVAARIALKSGSHRARKNNKQKQLFGIVSGMGGGQICLCVAFSWGNSETHKQNSQEISGKCRDSPGIIPGQSCQDFVYVFVVC